MTEFFEAPTVLVIPSNYEKDFYLNVFPPKATTEAIAIEAAKEATIAVVAELTDLNIENADKISTPNLTSHSDGSSPTSEPVLWSLPSKAFLDSHSQWIGDPIISQWRDPKHRLHDLIAHLDQLRSEWNTEAVFPFRPSYDPIWLDTGRVLAKVGLPWHNNQINMPEDLDTSWPFHFKAFEMEVMKAKGCRVGDSEPSGYVCNPHEGNLYCLRAIQQELRKQFPDIQPVLVYTHFSRDMIQAAESFFGLQTCHVDSSAGIEVIFKALDQISSGGLRPIIFAATLSTKDGKCDDMDLILQVSEKLPIMLHVDMSSNFDYITTLSEKTRSKLGIRKFTLHHKPLHHPLRGQDGSILASTIVAGSSRHPSAPVAALKPADLGEQHPRVAYTRAPDSTLAGSRDAINPLWFALHEKRFGGKGFSHMFQQLTEIQTKLVDILKTLGIAVRLAPYTLDIVIQTCPHDMKDILLCLGAIDLGIEGILLAISLDLNLDDVATSRRLCSTRGDTAEIDNSPRFSEGHDLLAMYPISTEVQSMLISTLQSWKVSTRSAAGYPFHMGSYSALGPIIANFLEVDIPTEWLQARSVELLTSRMESLGLATADDQIPFQGTFTNGSTMGNRIGIHAALKQCPGAFVYFSSASHYSVVKTLRDCDEMTNRWSEEAGPRFHEIPYDHNGSMLVDRLVKQAIVDKTSSIRRGKVYYFVIFVNMGTTFVGARDNIQAIHAELLKAEIQIAYIHIDGALDLGFGPGGITLGPPGSLNHNGLPHVQGITLSHHKALGNMVSGEVICYSPCDNISSLAAPIDPRIVFEAWVYNEVYTSSDLTTMLQYCLANAKRLEDGLRRSDVVTKRNESSIITVFERPPAWIIEEFSLRPEGDWVHFITMPHISPETVDFFIDRITSVDRQCTLAISYVEPCVRALMGRSMRMRRVRCQDEFATKLVDFVGATTFSSEADSTTVDAMRIATKTSLRGALTIAIFDEQDQVQVVFLAESRRDMSICPRGVVIRRVYSEETESLTDIARQLWGFMARHAYARLEVTETGCIVYTC